MTSRTSKYKSLATFLLLAVTVIAFGGCRRGHTRIGGTGWLSISPEVDSLTLALERGYVEQADTDVLREAVTRLDHLTQADSGNTLLSLRNAYWQLRLHYRMGDTLGCAAHIAETMQRADSATYPYEFHRLRWLTYPSDYGFSLQQYRLVSEDAAFYSSVGDKLFEADSYMCMGSMLQDIGSYERANICYSRADSLLQLAGYDNIRSFNRINHANVLFNLNRTAEGAQMLKEMLADTLFRPDPFAEAMALGNLYSWVGDTASLKRAYGMVRENGLLPDVEALYESFCADEMLARGHNSAALAMSRKAVSHDPCIYEWENGPDILSSHAAALNANGLTDSAYIFQHRADSLRQALERGTRAREIANADMQQRVAEYELSLNKRHAWRLRFLIGALVAVALVSGGLVFNFKRHLRHQRELDRKLQLDRKKADKHLLAMQLTMQEHDAMLSEMSRELVQLTRQGEITGAAGNRLETSIKTHKVTDTEREAFIETFSRLHPDFNALMLQAYPSLTESELKLAGYIAVDIDNKQIARILAIRPESVKQARWRLRNKMGLTRADDLKTAILATVDSASSD